MALNITFKEIFTSWPARYVAVAVAVNLFLISILEGSFPGQDTIVMFIVSAVLMIGISFVMRDYLPEPSFASAMINGALTYGVYSILLTFLKLSDSAFIMIDEVVLSLSFGLLTGIVYVSMRYFNK